ncbi:hypothetical protein [Tateyamaria sp.]|uniref:hypothetical protein n=1 Tax=Tateyamaria sp. TaxID=1929288 RepID=UPI003B21F679
MRRQRQNTQRQARRLLAVADRQVAELTAALYRARLRGHDLAAAAAADQLNIALQTQEIGRARYERILLRLDAMEDAQ